MPWWSPVINWLSTLGKPLSSKAQHSLGTGKFSKNLWSFWEAASVIKELQSQYSLNTYPICLRDNTILVEPQLWFKCCEKPGTATNTEWKQEYLLCSPKALQQRQPACHTTERNSCSLGHMQHMLSWLHAIHAVLVGHNTCSLGHMHSMFSWSPTLPSFGLYSESTIFCNICFKLYLDLTNICTPKLHGLEICLKENTPCSRLWGTCSCIP